MKKILLIFMILTMSLSIKVYAENEEIMQEQQETFEINEFLDNARQYTGDFFEDMDIKEILNEAIKGNIDNKGIYKKILSIFGQEVKTTVVSLVSILSIILIHSILKSISENLENSNISRIIYYVQYILIVTIIMTNVSEVITIVQDATTNLVGFINMLVPLLINLMLFTRKYCYKQSFRAVNIIYDKFFRKYHTRSTNTIGIGYYKFMCNI